MERRGGWCLVGIIGGGGDGDVVFGAEKVESVGVGHGFLGGRLLFLYLVPYTLFYKNLGCVIILELRGKSAQSHYFGSIPRSTVTSFLTDFFNFQFTWTKIVVRYPQ